VSSINFLLTGSKGVDQHILAGGHGIYVYLVNFVGFAVVDVFQDL